MHFQGIWDHFLRRPLFYRIGSRTDSADETDRNKLIETKKKHGNFEDTKRSNIILKSYFLPILLRDMNITNT
jgi:hypothetical protein